MLNSIKENVRLAAERQMLETPDSAEAVYSDAYEKSWKEAQSVEETVSIRVGRPKVEGEGDISLFADAASSLRDLMLSSVPGESARTLTSDEGHDPF